MFSFRGFRETSPRCANCTCNLLSWMHCDPYFSFRRSVPFPVLSKLIKKTKQAKQTETEKIYSWKVINISLFLLSCKRHFLSMWKGKGNFYCFSRPIIYLNERHQLQKFTYDILISIELSTFAWSKFHLCSSFLCPIVASYFIIFLSQYARCDWSI